MDRRLRPLLPLLPMLLLSACGGGKGSSAPPPANFVAVAQDQAVTSTWTDDPNVDYWLFIGPPGTTASNFANTAGAYAIPHVTSPYSISTLVFNGLAQSLTNGQDYDVSINARINGGPGGAATLVNAVRPRAAGSTFTASTPLVNTRDNLADNLLGSTFGVPYYYNGSVLQATGAPATFVFAGQAGATFYSTLNPDGVNYTLHATNNGLPTTTDIRSVTFDGSLGFLAAGTGGKATLSLDGITWTAQTTGSTLNLNNVASLGGSWVVSADGCHLYGVSSATSGSAQATAWGDYSAALIAALPTQCGSNTPANLQGSVVGSIGTASFLTLVGQQGLLAYAPTAAFTTSTPGWTAATVTYPANVTAASVTLRSVVYGAFLPTGNTTASPLWVAVGDYLDGNGNAQPLILYSYTLSNWTAATLPNGLTGHLNGVTLSRDPSNGVATQLVAVGDNGTILRSPLVTTTITNGVATTVTTATPAQTWVAATSNTTSNLNAISAGHFGFQAVGAAGTNVFSF